MSEFMHRRSKSQRKLLEEMERTSRKIRPMLNRLREMIFAIDEEAAYLEEEIREFNKENPENPYDFGESGY